MFKIALAGKAGTGKDTAAKLIIKELEEFTKITPFKSKILAFADPVKQIAKTMFPTIKYKHLYGPSEGRDQIIKNAKDAEGNPLTIRQLLLDIGTKVGRGYTESVWIDIMDYKVSRAEKFKTQAVVVSDLRFINEFKYLQENNFIILKLLRKTKKKLDHISETGQDLIQQVHLTIDNNGTKSKLKEIIKAQVLPLIMQNQ